MKGINTSGLALNQGGFASLAAPKGGVFRLAFPALAREWNLRKASNPLAPLGNEICCRRHKVDKSRIKRSS
ncbi:MAG: hypothetical protein K9K78_03100 [Spirochaetales bacterium]|nr:hypothetical protein [Spirochaetales bacterium]